jgi:hypothetical protein
LSAAAEKAAAQQKNARFKVQFFSRVAKHIFDKDKIHFHATLEK